MVNQGSVKSWKNVVNVVERVVRLPEEKPLVPTEIFYARYASTLANPVPAGSEDYVLLDVECKSPLYLHSIGALQLPNAFYKWYIDDELLDMISGPAVPGTIANPFKFPSPIMVEDRITLKVSNYGDNDQPNDGINFIDGIPFECVMSGVCDDWEVLPR